MMSLYLIMLWLISHPPEPPPPWPGDYGPPPNTPAGAPTVIAPLQGSWDPTNPPPIYGPFPPPR